MRILILQFIPASRGRPVPRFDPQLGILLTLLQRRGHELALCGLARCEVDAVKAALARDLPQLVYADISGVCLDAARRTLEYICQHEFLPIVAGGPYATADPAGALSLPGVQAAAVGEPDASLVTYFERIKDPVAGQVVPGVWTRDEQALLRPEVPHLVEDLNSLPFAERELFNYATHVRRTGQIEIAVGRGGPQRCAYCTNPGLAALYEGRGQWLRYRTPENVLAEIALLRERYAGVQRVRFLDHAFALDREWLGQFLPAYQQRCRLPFDCHLRLNSADEQTVRALAQAGCTTATVELISASDFLRNEIFGMELSGEQIETAFARLRAAGIAPRAIVYLGGPYESEASLAQTVNLLRRLRPARVDVRPYYPWPGTRARDLSRDNGWLHLRGEEQYHADAPGTDMPACRPAAVTTALRQLRGEFPLGNASPWWRQLARHLSRRGRT